MAARRRQAASRFYHGDAQEVRPMMRLLASEASVRNDQHLVKYTRSCFDMCRFDPQGTRLLSGERCKASVQVDC